MFKRTDVAVKGELVWQLRRRSGLIKTNRVEITTINLSIDGARVSTGRRSRLPVGASVLLLFGGEQSAARVRAVLPDPDHKDAKLFLLQFDTPDTDFLRVVDQWIDAGNGGNQFKSEYWRNHDIEEAS